MKEIALNYDTTQKIKKPDSGKKISRKKFDETLKKKMKDSGGTRIITTETIIK